ncbi:hypothetical protein D3C77_314310 [compost metagenome]
MLALLLVGDGQQMRVGAGKLESATARKQLADYRLEVSERDRRAAAQARTEEQRRQTAADEVERNGREQLELAQGRAVAAESAVVGCAGKSTD